MAEFRAVLERERERVNRTGGEFSLATFTPREPETRRETLDRLIPLLQRRVRLFDEIGYLDHEVVAVTLPATSGEGAWTVADDICLGFPIDCMPPLCRVYSYPYDSLPDDELPTDHDPQAVENDRSVRPMEPLFCCGLPFWKRLLDVVTACIGLVMCAPVFLVAAVAVKASSKGPVLFAQDRSGQGGKPFRFLKFRSMVMDAEDKKRGLLALSEQDGPAFKLQNDPRVTTVGRFLRYTSIDELPQLWNVLRGDMSMVGPRPLPCDETARCEPWHRRRLDVTPGVTGIWQVEGRSQVTFDEWMRMDMRYIRSRSLIQDLKLIFLTVPAVLLQRGAQ